MEQGLTVVIDYGMGNLGSITKAIRYVGGNLPAGKAGVLLSDNPEDLRRATSIVLPGVGAFGDGMKNLRQRGFIPVLEEEVLKNKKKFLGVCLGMQLLAKKSEEFHTDELGLGWIDAEVKKITVYSEQSESMEPPLKVPHVGWNTVVWKKGDHSPSDFYFVHSYHVVPKDPSLIMGVTDYGGEIVAAIAQENIFATQFHPEKSQKNGLKILENFLLWQP